MCNKYEIINEGGRKRIRALRSFTVQGRDVCFNDLGGYVYDEKTLSQDGNCWIFSGSLEYPGVHVMDEAIVDMGNDTAKVAPRMKACTIRGNSRIMGAVSFESASTDALQTPAMFEQGNYEGYAGVPYKASAKPSATRVRTKTMVWSGQNGVVSIPNAAYQVCVNKLDENGITLSTTSFKTGGEGVTIDLKDSAAFVIVVRKVGEAANMTPAEIADANITVTSTQESFLDLNNSTIVPVYNGVPADATHILQVVVAEGKSTMLNSCSRVECAAAEVNRIVFYADFVKINWYASITGNELMLLSGRFRNSMITSQRSTGNWGAGARRVFEVSDCENFSFSSVEFPDLAAMRSAVKTFYFTRCNMPATSALIYYDAKVNTWDNIDFTKVEPDHLGEALSTEPNTILVSSNVQGMFRLYRNMGDKVFGPLVEHLESVYDWEYGALESSYDSVIYKDCTISGKFDLFGHNVFGGTLGGKSTVTNTGADIIDINGNFRIEGNASVTDTPLRGTGYVGDNAELKNCKVEGYIYMAENAKAIPEVVPDTPVFRNFIALGNSRYLVHRAATTAPTYVILELRDNATVSGPIALSGRLVMRDNALIQGTGLMINVSGYCEMRENATVKGTAALTVVGSSVLVGNFLIESGNQTIYGNRILSDVSQIGETELPPMKQTW